MGRYQIINALMAIEAIRRSGERIDISTMQRGIAQTTLQGRFQPISVGNKTLILDVGHNFDAAAMLCETLRSCFHNRSICFVVGIMADKDFPAMIALYASIGSHIIFTQPKTARASKAESLAACLPDDKRTVYSDVGEAIDAALNREEEVVCVTGSFYTVGEAMEKLQVSGITVL